MYRRQVVYSKGKPIQKIAYEVDFWDLWEFVESNRINKIYGIFGI